MNCIHCNDLLLKKSKEKYCSIKCKMLHNISYENDCWIWNINRGKVRFNTKWYSAWRVSHEIYKGSYKGKLIGKICENFKCIRPEHMVVNVIKIIPEPEIPLYKKFFDSIIKLIKNGYRITDKRGI